MAQRIRDAFDAHIFLSYRKKDRRYANELMRLIHNNWECRDIACILRPLPTAPPATEHRRMQRKI